MKCKACGYEHEGEWVREGYKNIIGDEKFYEFFTAHEFMIENPIPRKRGDYGYKEKVVVSLYACPKCGTVRMEK